MPPGREYLVPTALRPCNSQILQIFAPLGLRRLRKCFAIKLLQKQAITFSTSSGEMPRGRGVYRSQGPPHLEDYKLHYRTCHPKDEEQSRFDTGDFY